MHNEVEKYYNLNDPSKKGPRGFVFAYDCDGNLLFTQENMIVLTGRKAIAEYGFDKEGTSKIMYAVLSNEKEPTTPNTSKIISVESTSGKDINYVIINRNIDENFEENLQNIDVNSKGQFVDKTKTDSINEPIPLNDIELSSKFAIKSDFISEEGKPFALCKIFFTESPIVKKEIAATNTGFFQKNNITNNYSCIRLYMGEINEDATDVAGIFENAVLFSRVVFPEYIKTIRNFMVFSYYIYF